MDIVLKAPRWARSYIELMAWMQSIGVEVDPAVVIERVTAGTEIVIGEPPCPD